MATFGTSFDFKGPPCCVMYQCLHSMSVNGCASVFMCSCLCAALMLNRHVTNLRDNKRKSEKLLFQFKREFIKEV